MKHYIIIHLYNYLANIYFDLFHNIDELRTLDAEVGFVNIKRSIWKLIINNNTLAKLVKLAENWHDKIETINSSKIFSASWTPLISDFSLHNLTICAFSSSDALKKHGKEMRHCIGNYVDKCLRNECNIFILSDIKGIKSTLEVIYGNKQHTQFVINQHVAKGNSEPSRLHINGALQLVSRLNNDIDFSNAIRRKEFTKNYSTNLASNIYKAYETTQSLPNYLKAKSYEEMIEKVLQDFKNIAMLEEQESQSSKTISRI